MSWVENTGTISSATRFPGLMTVMSSLFSATVVKEAKRRSRRVPSEEHARRVQVRSTFSIGS